MSDTVLVAIIAGTFSTLTGVVSLVGVWLTKRDVKTVRAENSDQHRTAQEERAGAIDQLMGKVDMVHKDVKSVGDTVAVVAWKLEDHIKSPH